VVANRVFVAADAVWSSAGVTTGIDLILHRIAGVCGPLVAARVAETMVVALRRGPADPELSPFLAHRGHLHLPLHRLQDAICQQPQADWTVEAMARVACVSPRHLARLFALHAGTSPLHYLQRIRLTTAEAALRAGARVGQAAELAGFSSDVQLRRAWSRLGSAGDTPSRARRPRGETPPGSSAG
jgi:transcriptional regulator GlxA family with amidase domain